MTGIPQELLDARSDPTKRAVLEDMLAEQGRRIYDVMSTGRTALMDPCAGAVAGAGAGAGAVADAGAVAVAGADAGAVADAGAGAVAGAGAGAGADAGAGAVAVAGAVNKLTKGAPEMIQALMVLVSQAGYYPLTRVGWARHKHGDEWELVNSRVVRGLNWGDENSLTKLALSKGNSKAHKFDPMNPAPEGVHRLHCVRPIPIVRADWEAWEKLCPRPEGWVDHE